MLTVPSVFMFPAARTITPNCYSSGLFLSQGRNNIISYVNICMFIAESKKSTFTVKNNPLAPGKIARPNHSITSKFGRRVSHTY